MILHMGRGSRVRSRPKERKRKNEREGQERGEGDELGEATYFDRRVGGIISTGYMSR